MLNYISKSCSFTYGRPPILIQSSPTSSNLQLCQERKVSIWVGRWGPRFRTSAVLSFYHFNKLPGAPAACAVSRAGHCNVNFFSGWSSTVWWHVSIPQDFFRSTRYQWPPENLGQDDFLSADPRLGIGKNQRLSLQGFDSDCGRTIEADLLHKDREHGTETETSLRLEHWQYSILNVYTCTVYIYI